MKKLLKIILYLFLALIFIIISLFLIAEYAEDKVAGIALKKVSESIHAPIEISDVSFSLLNNFPLATVEFDDVWVGAYTPDSAGNSAFPDSLISLKKLFVSFKIIPLLRNDIEIAKIEMVGASINYNVNTKGTSNFDFLIDTTQTEVPDTTSSNLILNLKKLQLEDISVIYNDSSLLAGAHISIPEMEFNGQMMDSSIIAFAEGHIRLTHCHYNSTPVGLMESADIEMKVQYENGELKIDHANCLVDQTPIDINGLVRISDQLFTDLKVHSDGVDVENVIKYVPQALLDSTGLQRITGVVNFDASIKGFVSDSVIPHVDVDLGYQKGSVRMAGYPALSNISLAASATNGKKANNQTTKVDIRALHFETPKSKADLKASISNLDRINYNVSANLKVSLAELAPYLPDTLVRDLDGNMTATLTTKGQLPDSITDEFIEMVYRNSQLVAGFNNLSFKMDTTLSCQSFSGQVSVAPNSLKIADIKGTIPQYHLNLTNVSLDAAITGKPPQLETLAVDINSMTLKTDSCQFSTSGYVRNLKHPVYDLKGDLNLDLSEVLKMLPDSLINNMTGKVATSFQSQGEFDVDSIADQVNDLVFEKSSFDFDIKNMTLNMPDSLMNLQGFSAKIRYRSDTVWMDRVNGNYLGLQFSADSTVISNVYTAAIQNNKKELWINGNFEVGDMDYSWIENHFLVEDSTTIVKSDNTNNEVSLDSSQMNFTYKINGKFKAKSLKYGDALFKNIDTKFLAKEGHYVTDQMKMDAFDGTSLSSVRVEMYPNDRMIVFFKTDVKKMDVSKMIRGFHQYIDMEDFTEKNVLGNLTTTMDGKIVMHNFEPVYDSLLLKGDLTLENGALINVKPVMAIEEIKIIGLKNMDKLYFTTLKSNLFLFKNKMYIPKTEIQTSSFDAMFLGMYSFGEDYAYHIRMFLGEVLSSKNKSQWKKQLKEGGFDESDEDKITKGRTTVYVVSKSENGKEKAGLDKKMDRLNMIAKVNLNKQMVDMNFHPGVVIYSTEK